MALESFSKNRKFLCILYIELGNLKWDKEFEPYRNKDVASGHHILNHTVSSMLIENLVNMQEYSNKTSQDFTRIYEIRVSF